MGYRDDVQLPDTNQNQVLCDFIFQTLQIFHHQILLVESETSILLLLDVNIQRQSNIQQMFLQFQFSVQFSD